MPHVISSARRAVHSPALTGLARFGLTARAFVYLVIGWLAVQIARGHGNHQANQKGALADIAQHSGGVALLWIIGAGFAAYAVWRLTEAAFGTAVDGRKTGPRVQSLIRGVVYGGFAVTTFIFIAGAAGPGQAQQQQTLTAKIMKHDAGRWLVGVVGLIVVAVGLGMVVEGAAKKFEKQLRTAQMSRRTRTVVRGLGMVGTMARGIVFAVAGALVVEAAVKYDARKSSGLDGALRTLADRPYGPWLLGVLALGLIVFGVYGFAAARWAKTEPGT
ncbi:MAG: DUF1206 domain-containing protein [Jatrophihabitantaceae bacterium]